MTDVAEGAPRSEDGYHWWDETAQQWQPMAEQSAGGYDSDRPAARVAAGLRGGCMS